MACCICNRAGHDEELHGEEGEEILALRARNGVLAAVAEAAERLVLANDNALRNVSERIRPDIAWRDV
jgi:hypothetical protein